VSTTPEPAIHVRKGDLTPQELAALVVALRLATVCRAEPAIRRSGVLWRRRERETSFPAPCSWRSGPPAVLR